MTQLDLEAVVSLSQKNTESYVSLKRFETTHVMGDIWLSRSWLLLLLEEPIS